MNYENDADVWGPHFWFVLLTVALNYPQETPPDGIRRRNYDFVQSLPLFLPDPHMGDNFAHIINEYPVSPYLDSRHHFVQWVNFIHNNNRLQTKIKRFCKYKFCLGHWTLRGVNK